MINRGQSLDGDGYVEEIPYTYGYHPELAPSRMRFALLLAGYEAPEVRRACELGFGRGLSLAVHAAATDIHWYGNDLLPQHVAGLRELVASSGARVTVFAEPFADFCTRDDLPSFDFIGLHGVWNWVSIENRARIVDFLNTRLAPGGVVYLGHNSLAGWRSMLPLRQWLVADVERSRAQGLTLADGIELARTRAAELADPELELPSRFLRGKSIAYLAHELFNRDWHPMAFSDVEHALQRADLAFVAEARGVDAFESLNFTAPQRAQLGALDRGAREDAKDRFLARKFRRDYFGKRGGLRVLSAAERLQRLQAQRIALACSRERAMADLVVGACAVRIDPQRVARIVTLLAEHGPLSIGEIATEPAEFSAALECVALLIDRAAVALVINDSVDERVEHACRAVNERLSRLAQTQPEVTVRAHPVYGVGEPTG